MEANTYQRLAMTTLNPALQDRDVLINGVMGLCGEAGEAIDLVKKHLHQRKSLRLKKHLLQKKYYRQMKYLLRRRSRKQWKI